MAKTATSRDLFAKLEDELKKKPIKGSKSAATSKPTAKGGENAYTAADIEVLEGLEPVRRRPGMYIGGTDEKAMHHLFAEVLDNAMDEAVAGHAIIIAQGRIKADASLDTLRENRMPLRGSSRLTRRMVAGLPRALRTDPRCGLPSRIGSGGPSHFSGLSFPCGALLGSCSSTRNGIECFLSARRKPFPGTRAG